MSTKTITMDIAHLALALGAMEDRMNVWGTTSQYLQGEDVGDDEIVHGCDDVHEADRMVALYQEAVTALHKEIIKN